MGRHGYRCLFDSLRLRGVGRPQVRLIRMQLGGKLGWVDSPRPVDENAGLARSAADAESHQETRSRCPPRTPRVMAAAVRATVGYRLIGSSRRVWVDSRPHPLSHSDAGAGTGKAQYGGLSCAMFHAVVTTSQSYVGVRAGGVRRAVCDLRLLGLRLSVDCASRCF